MKVVILAGGKGRRLRPYTTIFPKPLVPIGEHPVLEIILHRLAREGFTDITLSVGYLAELIRAYFDRPRPGLEALDLSYVYEEDPLGTAGALHRVPDLTETFLFLNGDILTSLNFTELIEYHKTQGAALTIAARRAQVNIDFGVLYSDDDSRIVDFREKPVLEYDVSMGIYVAEPKVLEHLPGGGVFDFPDLVLALLEAGERVVGYFSDAFWLDIGRPEDYERAQEIFAEGAMKL